MGRKRKYKKRKFKIFSWKALDKRFRIKRKLRLLAAATLVLVATFGTYFSIYLFQSFRNPFVQAEGGLEVPFSWQAKEPKSFALLISRDSEHRILDQAAVLHIDPQKERVVVLDVSESDLSLSHGVPSCLSALSQKLSTPVNGYFLFEKSALEELSGEDSELLDWKKWDLSSIFKLPTLLRVGKGHFWSNLSLPEILRASRFILGTREDQRIQIDYSEGIGSDGFTTTFFRDQKVETESARVLILNGTNIAGLAGSARSWLENLGCFVLDVGNAPQQNQAESLILAVDPKLYTVQRISKSLRIDVVKELDQSLEWAKRADIVVILGVDKKGFF